MLRRVLAVAAGFATCQISMLACLALGIAVLTMLRATPLLAVVGVIPLLLAPGLAGGGLAGFLTDRFGWFYGLATASLFGLSTAAVQIIVLPRFPVSLVADPLPVGAYLALVVVLAVCGAVGGTVGHRWRARPAASPALANTRPLSE